MPDPISPVYGPDPHLREAGARPTNPRPNHRPIAAVNALSGRYATQRVLLGGLGAFTLALLAAALIAPAALAEDTTFSQDASHGVDLGAVFYVEPEFDIGQLIATGDTEVRPVIGGSLVLGIPVAPRGFLDDRNDAFFIELVGSFGTYLPDDGTYPASALIGVRYQLFIFQWLAPFAAARVGVGFKAPNVETSLEFAWSLGLGVMFTFDPIAISLAIGDELKLGIHVLF